MGLVRDAGRIRFPAVLVKECTKMLPFICYKGIKGAEVAISSYDKKLAALLIKK